MAEIPKVTPEPPRIGSGLGGVALQKLVKKLVKCNLRAQLRCATPLGLRDLE